jgi:excisionase family DNA binding protein
MPNNAVGDRLLTVRQLADYLGYGSRVTIYRKIREEGLPFERIGARYRFRREDVERWVCAQTEAARASMTEAGS